MLFYSIRIERKLNDVDVLIRDFHRAQRAHTIKVDIT